MKTIKTKGRRSATPKIILSRGWFKGNSLGRTMSLSVPIIILFLILFEAYQNEDPRLGHTIGSVTLIIIGILFVMWRTVARAVPAEFELYDDIAIMIPKIGFRREIPLDTDSRLGVLRKDRDKPFSFDNVSGYLFFRNPRNKILIDTYFGWKDEDIKALWVAFFEIIHSGRCSIIHDPILQKYLQDSTEPLIHGKK